MGRTSLQSRLDALLTSTRPDVLEDYWWGMNCQDDLFIAAGTKLPFTPLQHYYFPSPLPRPCFSHLVSLGRIKDALKLMDVHDVMQGHLAATHPSMMPQASWLATCCMASNHDHSCDRTRCHAYAV